MVSEKKKKKLSKHYEDVATEVMRLEKKINYY